ncbi:MerR family DNA-binding protein [Salinisphaera sp.]|uniref:MerR family transcriptional regulator n=1 Tax=Salinisphaera sp. TaxID=1914330 RepID=UPI0025D1A93B|nr:MerR family DNA-binding protein [Salinisphaera sp.]
MGKTARILGMSVDTLRYYEKIGLLPPVARDSQGRRHFAARDLRRLRFIQRAQRCDFSLDEIRVLLESRSCRDAARPEVARLTQQKLRDVQARIAELNLLQQELGNLLQRCEASDQGCPIIDRFDAPTK